MKKIIKTLLIIIFLSIFIYCIYNIIIYLNNSRKSEKINDNLKNIAIKEIQQNNNTKYNDEKSVIPIEVDFDKLNKINNNIQAWIYMEDSIINYPIVKSSDNKFYLTHSVDGSYNQNGALFMDYRNNENFEDKITYIYGHHMKNNTMFGNLEYFKEQEYYNNHEVMYLFTKNEKLKIQIFAGFTTEDGSKIYNCIGSKSNNEIVEYAKDKSNFETDVEILPEDEILVLSTCSYDYENARYVVLGILRKI